MSQKNVDGKVYSALSEEPVVFYNLLLKIRKSAICG